MSKLVYGMGVNDADCATFNLVDGKQVMCPFYRKWSSMLERCYSLKFQERQPAYKGCSVSEDWLHFSVFKKWMSGQDWKGKHLDKDLLTEGNKLYSPDTCLLVDGYTNNLLTGSGRGDLPTGVRRNGSGYQAQCSSSGKLEGLGTYKTQVQARAAYLNYKVMVLIDHAELLNDRRVANALVKIAYKLSLEAEEISLSQHKE